MTASSVHADIRERSSSLRRHLSVLLVALAGTLAFERFGSVGLQLIGAGFAEDGLRRLAFECTRAFPEVLFLVALWWIRQAMVELARGDLFAPTIARMLERVGILLAIGAFIAVFVVPGASRLLGHGPGYLIAYDVSGLVLGAVGLSLKVIAQLVRRASELQAELDGMF